MVNLVDVYLSDNFIDGSIPGQLFNLSNLEHLLLQNNKLTGTIPSELAQLSKIRELVLAQNYLSGSIPTEINQLVYLERISLRAQRGGNYINGSLPDFSLAQQLWYVILSSIME